MGEQDELFRKDLSLPERFCKMKYLGRLVNRVKQLDDAGFLDIMYLSGTTAEEISLRN